MSPILSLDGVTRFLGNQPILHDVSLSIPSAQTCAIVGPSGSGKSTLLNLMGLLDQPCQGRVLLAGRDMTAANADQRAILREGNEFDMADRGFDLGCKDEGCAARYAREGGTDVI